MRLQPLSNRNFYHNYLFIFLVTFIFYLFLQLQIVFQFYWSTSMNWLGQVQEMVKLLFSQNENLLAALGLVFLFVLFQRRRAARLVYVGLFALLLIYLILNQLFYITFFDHLQFNYVELRGLSLTRFSDSLWSKLGLSFYVNLTLAAGLVALLYWRLVPAQPARPLPVWSRELRRHKTFYSLMALTFVGFGYLNADFSRNYVHHPLFTLTGSLFRREVSLNDYPYNPNLDIYTQRYGRPTFDERSEAVLLDYAQRWGSRPRPNLVYLVLESVGSLNMLPNGRPDPAITPHLSRFWPQAIVFPAIYNTFPGSERSHLPISTGGYTYTGGGGFKSKAYRYTGPTLVGEMKQQGYRTGLFSATFMDTENFIQVYQNLPFDEAFIPDWQSEAFNRQHRLNSWGLNEEVVLDQALHWLDGQPAEQPFFLMFLTSASHHPYTVPAGYPAPFPGDDDLNRYRNTLHFSDYLLGRLVDYLAQTGQLDHTILVISGDHGQAFGDRHPTNFLHKHHLYEENIKNFLLLLDFTETQGPLVSAKLGFIGDIMPTLLSLAGRTPPEVNGQNLFSPDYRPRIRYFHKSAHPEQWGLLDGQWKFITDKNGNRSPQLYNLADDPAEQHNLAARYPDKVETYHLLVAHWYIRTDQEMTARLADPAHYVTAPTTLAGVTTAGPHLLLFGRKPAGEAFQPLEMINPQEDMVAWTRGVAYQQETTLTYEWISPTGVIYPVEMTYSQKWSAVWLRHPAAGNIEPGRWQLRILDAGGRLLLQGAFLVSPDAPLYTPRTANN